MDLSVGLLIPFLGTTLGAAMVFLMKNSMNKMVFAVTLHNIPEGMAVRSDICRCNFRRYWNYNKKILTSYVKYGIL